MPGDVTRESVASAPGMAPAPAARKQRWKTLAGVVVLIAVVGGLLAAAPAFRQTFVNYADSAEAAVKGLGIWGPVIVAAAYIPASVLLLPGSPLSLFAGFAFGWTVGVITVSAGSTAGATCAFLVARTFGRERMRARFGNNPTFDALDAAVKQSAWKVVFLTRLSPVFPFNVLNFLLGLTPVTLPQFVIGSWLGMLPGTIAYVGVGAAAGDLKAVLRGEVPASPWQTPLLIVGVIATFVVVTLVARNAAAVLKKVTADARASQETAAVSAKQVS